MRKYYYTSKSAAEHGTIYQLRNAINRTNVINKPLDRFDACEDFFLLVVECHIIVAAMTMLEMKSLDDVPNAHYAEEGSNTWMLPARDCEFVLNQIMRDLLDKFLDVSYNSPLSSSSTDMAHLYATQVMSLGCLYMEFRDAIKEGDGLCILRCYRYLLPIFKSSGRKNYAIETLTLLLQHDYILSERQANELIWTRFVKTRGSPGSNIPNDLHCEHFNRLCKTAVKGLGANKTEECIQIVAKAIGTLDPVLNNFDTENMVSATSTSHKVSGMEKDMKCLVAELTKTKVFDCCDGRSHPSFSKPRVPLHAKPEDELLDWIKTHIHF